MQETQNLTLEQLEKDDSFFIDLKDENFCLVLGAGFSYGIKNQTFDSLQNNIPLTSDFIKLTESKFAKTPSDFKEAANEWKNNFKTQEGLTDSFRKMFLVDENVFQKDKLHFYKNILLPNWYRLYTFNFDNLFETITKQTKKEDAYEILSFPNNNEFPSDSTKKYFAHIHGKITADSDILSLVFYSKEYSNFYENTDNLYYTLKNAINDENQKKNLIIVGCKFNEDIIYKNFLNKINREGVKIFHFDIAEPIFDKSILGSIDYHFIKCSTEEFLKFIGKHKNKILNRPYSSNSYNPQTEINDLHGLDKVSKNFSIVENPIAGRFGNKNRILGWEEGKLYVSYEKNKLLNFETNFKLFVITGSAGSGKSTLLLQNVDNYISAVDSDKRRIIFLHPDAIYSLENTINKEEKYLIVIDSLDRNNSEENSILVFEPIFRIIQEDSLDIKFLFSIYESSWNSILKKYIAERKINFNLFYYELKANEGRKIEGVFDKLSDYYKIQERFPHLNWIYIRKTTIAKANFNPSFIRYILEDASQETFLNEIFFEEQPEGIYQLIWKEIHDIPNSNSEGVIIIILLLSNFPLLSLSRDSIKYLLSKNNKNDKNETLEFLWNNILKETFITNNLKGLDPVFQECIKNVIKDENLISDIYLSEFTKQYRDYFNSEFKKVCGKIIQDTKVLIDIKNLKEYKHLWKATELLLLDNSDEMLNFITSVYSIGLKKENELLSKNNELILYLKHLWQQRLWKLQMKEVLEYDFESNQKKQIEVFNLRNKLVESIYFNDPFKLHEFANQLRKFCLPAFSEVSKEYNEITNAILKWYNESNKLHDDKDILSYQAISKFYLETNEFEKAIQCIERGLIKIEGLERDNPKLISLLATQADILLTKAEILFILNETKAESDFNLAKMYLVKCDNFINEKFDLKNIPNHNKYDIENNIRGFYTYYGQFIDRSIKLRLSTFPSEEDINDANLKLDFADKFLPPHKDTVVANTLFKLNHFKSIYPKANPKDILESIGEKLIQRFDKFKEPKIIDAIRSLIHFSRTRRLTLDRINELKKIANQKKPSPHIIRNARWLIEKIEKEISDCRYTSQEDLVKLNKLLLQPFNFSSAQNMIRALIIQYCLLEKESKSTMAIKKRILEIYTEGNIHYKLYFIKSFYSLYKKIFDSNYFTAEQFISLCNDFNTIIPNKKNINERLLVKYKQWFYEVYNKDIPLDKKISLLENVLFKFSEINFNTESGEKLKKFYSILSRLKSK